MLRFNRITSFNAANARHITTGFKSNSNSNSNLILHVLSFSQQTPLTSQTLAVKPSYWLIACRPQATDHSLIEKQNNLVCQVTN